MTQTPHWQHFEHVADIGVRGFGSTLAQAFEQAALAMCALITDLSLVKQQRTIDFECADSNPELLLADWLNAVVFEISTRRMLFSRFEVQIAGDQLTARGWGEAINKERHHPAVEVKGATYTQLSVSESHGRWMAQCVVDV